MAGLGLPMAVPRPYMVGLGLPMAVPCKTLYGRVRSANGCALQDLIWVRSASGCALTLYGRLGLPMAVPRPYM